jgi:hypothetical protein
MTDLFPLCVALRPQIAARSVTIAAESGNFWQRSAIGAEREEREGRV